MQLPCLCVSMTFSLMREAARHGEGCCQAWRRSFDSAARLRDGAAALRTCFDCLLWAPLPYGQGAASGFNGLGPKVMPLVQIAPDLGP
jgi:hypothetical protein